MIRLVRSGTPVNMGPHLGEQTHNRDGVVIDYWPGGTSWRAMDTATWDRVNAVLTGQRPDPEALHGINWELVPEALFACTGDHSADSIRSP